MMRPTPLALTTVVAVFLIGCGARQLSSLQSEMDNVLRQRADCENGVAPGGSCVRDFTTEFADIAAQAREAIDDHDTDDAVKAGLYRLEVVARWQAGDDDARATDIARTGRGLCDAGLSAKAPRDCALLQVIPEFIETESATREIRKIKADGSICTEAASQEFSRRYEADYFGPLLTDVREASGLPGMHDGVKAYLKAQAVLAAGQAETLHTEARACLPSGGEQERNLGRCFCPDTEPFAGKPDNELSDTERLQKQRHEEACPAVAADPPTKLAHDLKCAAVRMKASANAL